MRFVLSAVLLCSPLALGAIAATPASADSAIGELRATEAPPLNATPTTTAPETGTAGTTDRMPQAVRRHHVAGSHYEREHLRRSQIHG